MTETPYIREIRHALPRILSFFDTDSTSETHGVGDRFYWAWSLIDFGNGTFQGAAHGLAQLWRAGLWPHPTPPARFVSRIDAMFAATGRLTRRDGSLEEAFPYEGSFCVTALVAYDLLCALDLMDPELDDDTRHRWRETIRPLIGFLDRADETHALISNHLATAVAALLRWHRLTQEDASETRARELLDRILANQSDEGWFREYQGADPGYQTLCTLYLADVHQLRPDWQLLEPLRRSLRFLWHFAHPDGSFGGLYGSRCTRFYYPAGIEALAGEIPEAAALSKFMAESIAAQTVVTLSAIDAPNLVPMFNAYCRAAALAASEPEAQTPVVPALDTAPLRRCYPHAGLVVDRGPEHYTIIATAKGGVTYHFVSGQLAVLDSGVVVRNRRGRLASTQHWDARLPLKIKGDTVVVEATFAAMPKQAPGPWQFIGLRVLCVTAFRIPRLREWVKRRLVTLLITGANTWSGRNVRTIPLGTALRIEDATELPAGCSVVEGAHAFVSIHMASQGYWQAQDER